MDGEQQAVNERPEREPSLGECIDSAIRDRDRRTPAAAGGGGPMSREKRAEILVRQYRAFADLIDLVCPPHPSRGQAHAQLRAAVLMAVDTIAPVEEVQGTP